MEDKLKELMKDELFARGYKIRRQAFGDAVVEADAAVRMNDEFQRPMWQHGVQAAWGLLWSRPGLDARARSIATLSALVALNVPDEIEKHVRAAVSNGAR
jgi:alkylhydroperoxidase/carboxymuconolactone decarboxylase family protein YurZ